MEGDNFILQNHYNKRQKKHHNPSKSINKNTNMSRSGKDDNYYLPLQSTCEDRMDSADIDDSEPVKPIEFVPPLIVLKQKSEVVRSLIDSLKIDDYLLKNISLGQKILCKSFESYNKIANELKSKSCEFYTHEKKGNRPFKVVLSGLDLYNVETLKNELITLGIKCIDIKPIALNPNSNYIHYIYIVNIERGSIKMNELRASYKSVLKTIVKWDFKRQQPNKITQCHNCQMYGHRAMHCQVKTFCSSCSGNHKTIDCTEPQTAVKCANCNGAHKSTDP